jgi:Domain of unknown function (DUF4288)
MNWYIAKIVFNININEGYNQSQFDEQLRLIEAINLDEALEKAKKIGKAEEHFFTNSKQEKVHWNFIDVMELNLLPELKHGAELYSFTHTTDKLYDYIYLVQQKSKSVQKVKSIYV